MSGTVLNDAREGYEDTSASEGDVDSSTQYGLARRYDGGLMRVLCSGDDPKLLRSTAVLVVVWFTISYGTYGVATWNNQLFADVGLRNPYLCSFIFALSNLPGNVASILLVERVRYCAV